MKRYPTKQYAKALFFSCPDDKALELVYRDTVNLSALIKSSEELRSFLANPIIPSQKKKEILENIFREKLNPLTFQFLLFLEKKRRLVILAAICAFFEDIYLEKNGIVKATIIVRDPLADSQVEQICLELQKALKKTIRPQVRTEPGILGGIKVKVGDLVFDFSLRTQLEQFKRVLIGA